MQDRARKCFEKQTYTNRRILICDESAWDPISYTVGKHRNAANEKTPEGCIIAHLDDDDYSHPNRLAEQVALLQSSKAEAVGYHDMVFWERNQFFNVSPCQECGATEYAEGCDPIHFKDMRRGCISNPGEAWLYQHGGDRYALGTSLMYWRKTWERVKFPDTSKGEDTLWLREVKCQSVSGFMSERVGGPRMIAEIHGSNTSSRIHRDSDQFTRIPELDKYCSERMKL